MKWISIEMELPEENLWVWLWRKGGLPDLGYRYGSFFYYPYNRNIRVPLDDIVFWSEIESPYENN